MANSTSTPNRSLNQILTDEDASKIILSNKNALIALVIVLVLTVIGYGVYSTVSIEHQTLNDSKIYQFENGPLKLFEQNHESKALIASLQNLKSSVGNYVGLLPVVIKTSDSLMAQGQLAESLQALIIGQDSAKNDYAKYFLLSRMAVVYEDLGQDQNAIETLEKMNSKSVKIFEGKNYLDLGRLYLKKGDKEKAKASFNYVIEKVKDDIEFVKIAKIYLSRL